MSANASYEKVEAGGLRWRVLPAWRGALEKTLAPNLADLGRVPGATRVKHNNVRTVWRTPLEGGPAVFVKRYDMSRLRDRAKALLRGSKAAVEFKVARAVAARGIAAPRPVALGERRRGPFVVEAVLILEEIPNQGALGPYFERRTAEEGGKEGYRHFRWRFAGDIGRWLWKVHRAGVRHGDLHGGNVLVTEREDGAPRLSLIDLHRASAGGLFTERARARNLAQLLHSLRLGLPRSDRLRVLRAYYDEGHFGRAERDAWSKRIAARWNRIERTRLRSRTNRCVRRSSEFDHRKARGENLYRRRALPEDAARALLAAHAETVRAGAGTILKSSRRCRVTVQEAGGKRYAVKEIFEATPWARAKNLLFGSRGMRAWYAAEAFRVRGIPTPTAVALREKKALGLVGESTLVTEYLEGLTDLDRWLFRRWGAGKLSREQIREKRAFLRRLAAAVRAIHDQGLYHSDLSGKNLFVREADGALYTLDLESVRMRRRLTDRRRAKNLCQVSDSLRFVHRTDARRFFRYYARGTALDTREGWLAVLRQTRLRQEKRAAKQRRKGVA